ncbi:hypothetical protein LINPERPRIM_LOCUS38087 [Linum perenne]
MDDDTSYGGNDIGVFNLRDGKIKKLDDGLTEIDMKIEPPPSWIVPSPWIAMAEVWTAATENWLDGRKRGKERGRRRGDEGSLLL